VPDKPSVEWIQPERKERHGCDGDANLIIDSVSEVTPKISWMDSAWSGYGPSGFLRLVTSSRNLAVNCEDASALDTLDATPNVGFIGTICLSAAMQNNHVDALVSAGCISPRRDNDLDLANCIAARAEKSS
jgi:hypothetical protein